MKIKILYATESGSTKYVAGVIKKFLESENHEVDQHNLNTDGSDVPFTGYDLILFGSPTYDYGQPQTEMVTFLDKCKTDLSQTKVAVFCLGESWYPKFCGAADVIEKWISDRGGKVLVPTLKIDGYPLDTSSISDWVKKVCSSLI